MYFKSQKMPVQFINLANLICQGKPLRYNIDSLEGGSSTLN